jgi:ADP-ribosylglycohydrolase
MFGPVGSASVSGRGGGLGGAADVALPDFDGGVAEDRALGAVIGNALGDALGAPLEFQPVSYDTQYITGFDADDGGSFMLRPGQWTDDASMGLCLADSLLVRGGWDPVDAKARFIAWWSFGYDNAFRFDTQRFSRGSVGLGGNISESFAEFGQNGRPYTTAGNEETSGNGSLMRLAPVPVYFHDNKAEAMRVSALSSLLTHRGQEAAELCSLMAMLVVGAIHEGDGTPAKVLSDIDHSWARTKGVQFLAQSLQETPTPGRKWDIADRNWQWRADTYRYAPERARRQPGYVGSYAMDAMSMALHCVWSTSSFAEAALKSANMRGDADTVCAITCELAGAIYGARAIPKDWIRTLQQWDNNGEIALRGHKLFHHKPVRPVAPEE